MAMFHFFTCCCISDVSNSFVHLIKFHFVGLSICNHSNSPHSIPQRNRASSPFYFVSNASIQRDSKNSDYPLSWHMCICFHDHLYVVWIFSEGFIKICIFVAPIFQIITFEYTQNEKSWIQNWCIHCFQVNKFHLNNLCLQASFFYLYLIQHYFF